jgi:hypothetical protein
MAKTDDSVTAEFQKGMSELKVQRFAALDSAVDIHAAFQSLLLNEVQRIERKFGRVHVRSKQITDRLGSNAEIFRALEVEKQLTRIELPEIAAGGALIYGRVVDQDGLGIDRLLIYLADQSGGRIDIDDAATDASGFFSIALDSEQAARAGKVYPNAAFLIVASLKRRPIYRHSKPVTLAPGTQHQLLVRLNRSDLSATAAADTGPQETPVVTVPYLVGSTFTKAKRDLKAAQLSLGRVTGPKPTRSSIVQKQEPEAETRVPKGTPVNVVISSGSQ